MEEITSDELTALVGEPIQRVKDKVRAALHELDREWLAASPFCLVATSGADGRCDVSPKGIRPASWHTSSTTVGSPSPSGPATDASTATAISSPTRTSG